MQNSVRLMKVNQSQLTICGLTKSFPGKLLFAGVDLRLPAAITCLVCRNGSGKTILFNLITGFLRPDAPSASASDGERAGVRCVSGSESHAELRAAPVAHAALN